MITLIIDEDAPSLTGLIADFVSGGIGKLREFANGDTVVPLTIRTAKKSASGTRRYDDTYVSGDTLYVGIGTASDVPVCLGTLTTALAAAAVTVSEYQAASATANEIRKISFTDGTYGGFYTLSATVGGVTTVCGSLSPLASAQQVMTALLRHAFLRESNVTVRKEGADFLIEFIGNLTGTAPTLAATNISLLAPTGVTGTLTVNTDELADLFEATDATALTLQFGVTRERSGGADLVVFQDFVTVHRSVVDPTTAVPTPNIGLDAYIRARAVVYDAAQTLSDAQQARARTNIGAQGYREVLASTFVTLNSNLSTGGGTDVTTAFNAGLLSLSALGGATVIIDGVAHIQFILVPSNITLRGVNKATCGFYQKSGSNRIGIRNINLMGYDYRLTQDEPVDHDIKLINFTLNCNGAGQDRGAGFGGSDTSDPKLYNAAHIATQQMFLMGWAMYGIRNFYCEGVTIKNCLGFGWLLCNGRGDLEIASFTLYQSSQVSYQDTGHIWGPCDHVKIGDITTNGGDDVIAVAIGELVAAYPIGAGGIGACPLVTVDSITSPSCRTVLRVLSNSYAQLGTLIIEKVKANLSGNDAAHFAFIDGVFDRISLYNLNLRGACNIVYGGQTGSNAGIIEIDGMVVQDGTCGDNVSRGYPKAMIIGPTGTTSTSILQQLNLARISGNFTDCDSFVYVSNTIELLAELNCREVNTTGVTTMFVNAGTGAAVTKTRLNGVHTDGVVANAFSGTWTNVQGGVTGPPGSATGDISAHTLTLNDTTTAPVTLVSLQRSGVEKASVYMSSVATGNSISLIHGTANISITVNDYVLFNTSFISGVTDQLQFGTSAHFDAAVRIKGALTLTASRSTNAAAQIVDETGTNTIKLASYRRSGTEVASVEMSSTATGNGWSYIYGSNSVNFTTVGVIVNTSFIAGRTETFQVGGGAYFDSTGFFKGALTNEASRSTNGIGYKFNDTGINRVKAFSLQRSSTETFSVEMDTVANSNNISIIAGSNSVNFTTVGVIVNTSFIAGRTETFQVGGTSYLDAALTVNGMISAIGSRSTNGIGYTFNDTGVNRVKAFSLQRSGTEKCSIEMSSTATSDGISLIAGSYSVNFTTVGTLINTSFIAGRTETFQVGGGTYLDSTLYVNGVITGIGSAITAISASNISAGTLAVAYGGTGQTTYTNGQLLIGNTTGNTLTKATLTGTSNQVVVTNGGGSITLSTPQDIGTSSNPQFATIELGAASDTTLARVSAGVISVEGVTVATASNTLTFTNKSIDAGQLTGTVSQSNIAALTGDVTKPSGSGVTALANIPAIAGTNLTGTGANFTAGNATKWTTGRTVSLTGDVTYTSGSLDGSGNVTGAATLAATSNTTLTSLANLVTVGTLTGGATGAGFTIALTTSTVTGTLPDARNTVSNTTTTSMANLATVGTITSGVWNAGAVTSSGAGGFTTVTASTRIVAGSATIAGRALQTSDYLVISNGATASTDRCAMRWSQGGYAAPSAANADSAGDKLVFVNQAGGKSAIGAGTDYDMWFQGRTGGVSASFYGGTTRIALIQDSAGTAYNSASVTITGTLGVSQGVYFNSTLSVAGAITLTGGILGTTAGGSATAGNVGEYVSASVVQGSATALATATPKTVTSISLTAGDWDITGIGALTGASTGTEFDVAIGTTTNSFTGTVLGDTRCQTPTVSLTGADASLMIPAVRVTISGTTTYYLIVQETFTIGTPAAYGRISARRVR